ncbi:MAG: chemotaxis response regulator protein-glutamate methylesterase [Lamprobacter sp.]|uniref:protein-glutamate methylesterase/protein-glutamine glutaminase n=1 Tax=Lamprobacter sp. TaxID=3100796 RepID=UPI002B2567FA|nr:chemotaxis response regulator protein-glutamate methylesterase [Lamprobacter sp.]MEA3639093.1 chemotaxis response regulator protein-glutamate methylesterase [Lamprobacter sp.]
MKVLVADDSSLYRRLITEALKSLPGIGSIDQASNGRLALKKVQELQPDLLTLDMDMPEMDGLAVLDALKQLPDPPIVIVVSSLTQKGGHLAIKAMQRGAFDFITKPATTSLELSLAALREELAPRLKSLSVRFNVRSILHKQQHSSASVSRQAAAGSARPSDSAAAPSATAGAAGGAAPSPATSDTKSPPPSRPHQLARPEMLLIGVSTGGPNALDCLIPALPATLGVPVFVVQHMPPLFTKSLAEHLADRSALKVCEAVHDTIAEAGTVYIAPGGHHMRLAHGAQGQTLIQITDEAPENHCRPSVDYLFRSAAKQFPGRAMAVILTGMGSDGTQGLRELKRDGCFVIAQDEATCVVYGMPKIAVEAGVVDRVLPLDAIAERVVATIKGRHP